MIRKYYTQELILLNEPTSTGGYWDTTTGVYTTAVAIKAAVNQASAREVAEHGKIGQEVEQKLWADKSSEVYAGRRLRWSGDDYVITTEPKDVQQMGHHIEFYVRRVW